MDCLAPPIRVAGARRRRRNKSGAKRSFSDLLDDTFGDQRRYCITPRKPAIAGANNRPVRKSPGETLMSSTVEPSGAIETVPIEDTSLLAFYRDMNPPERRTFWAFASGFALDGMDFMIYPLVIRTIIALWKVDPGTADFAATLPLLP